jgi:hypothetical protein
MHTNTLCFFSLFFFFVGLEQDKYLDKTDNNENLFILIRSKEFLFYSNKKYYLYSKLALFLYEDIL